MYRPRDNKGRYIKIRNNIETKPSTTKPLTPKVQERKRDLSLGKVSRQEQIQCSQSIKLGIESPEWTKEFTILWEEDMDPNNNGEEIERLAREAVDRARLEGESIRQEDERKAKEDEDGGSNNEEQKEEELTFGFPIYDIPATFSREVKMKNISPYFQIFMVHLLKILMLFFLNLMFYVELIDILVIHKRLDYF